MFTSTESYLISNFKKQVISLPLVSHHVGTQRRTQNLWETVEIKKNEEEEEHQRNTNVAKTTKKNGKLSRKETEICERCIRSWNLLRNYLKWVKNYKEICDSVSGRYSFFGWNQVFRPVQLERSRYYLYLNWYGMRSFLYYSRHRYGKYRPYRSVRYETDYIAMHTQRVHLTWL